MTAPPMANDEKVIPLSSQRILARLENAQRQQARAEAVTPPAELAAEPSPTTAEAATAVVTADPFATLAEMRVWTAWRGEERNGKITKVPYNANGVNQSNKPERACANDPATWTTRDKAQRMSARIANGHGGGVMVALGAIGDGMVLAGVDLDSCLNADGTLADWAKVVVGVLPTYGEVSPSGRGLKFYAYVADRDVRQFLDSVGVDQTAWGCRRTPPGENGADHGPAVEVYFKGRVFVTTGQRWPASPNEIVALNSAALAALAGALPAKKTAEPINRQGDKAADDSRSADALRIAWKVRAGGSDFDAYCRAVRTNPLTASWYLQKGVANDMRELRRAWQKTESNESETPDTAPAFSDEALALEFAEVNCGRLRYVATWGRWYEWDGTRWKPDGTLRAYDLARATCRTVAARVNKSGKTQKGLASAATVAGVERLARADRRIAATVDQWDCDPWLLNTPGGTVDLRTGELRPNDRSDLLTKVTAVAPGGDCPLWLEFLDRITGGDKALQAFLQRWCGYALTGVTSEHALAFCYGTGANGKSTFLNTVSGVIGDYAMAAPMETFTATGNERHPTELAGLRGARLVTAQETEEGRRWAESRIKALTGGDAISARFMRQDFFTFTPQFKLTLAGNHRPGLRAVDEAIRRRMILIPFAVSIPAQERDERLGEKLRDEWPGILAWMIAGCREWQERGLDRPEIVTAATDEYLSAEDVIEAWRAERCTDGANDKASSSELFESWRNWAEENGEFAGSQRKFSQKLLDRGLEKTKDGKGSMVFVGIGLKPLLKLAT